MNSGLNIFVLLICAALFLFGASHLFSIEIVLAALFAIIGLVLAVFKIGVFCYQNAPQPQRVESIPNKHRLVPAYMLIDYSEEVETLEDESDVSNTGLQKEITPKQFYNLSEKEQALYRLVRGGFEEKTDRWGNVYFEQETVYVLK